MLKEQTSKSVMLSDQVGAANRKGGLLSELDTLDTKLSVLREVVTGTKAQLEPIMDSPRPKNPENEKDGANQAPFVNRVRDQIRFVDEIINIVEDLRDRLQL
jgi:hypothetical protein